MSANLDLVRSIYAAWERGDFSSAEWAHPDIEYAWVGGPERGSGRGVTEMREALRNFLAPWEDFRAEVEEYREMDRERVLVLIHHRGRGKTSGLELGQMQTNNASLFHVRDGTVTRFVAYWDRERALADLGLAPEEGAHYSPD
jgi:ketosteroid isomerase-like protein